MWTQGIFYHLVDDDDGGDDKYNDIKHKSNANFYTLDGF
jgi:hypothetical protein